MQETYKNNILSSARPLKHGLEKDFNPHRQHQTTVVHKNFLNGLQNARKILNSLERSLGKTRKYEKELVKCRASHSHTHDVNEWWESDISDKSKSSKAGATKVSRSQVNLAESWSTMSIVCLQYQYEELAKRYSSLLQAYNERCSSLSSREAALVRLKARVNGIHTKLAQAHRTLLIIGEKYLALREKRVNQKREYEEKIDCLKRAVEEVLTSAERASAELDDQLAHSMGQEEDGATALLLDEIRKCNLLYLENLRLKARLEIFVSGN